MIWRAWSHVKKFAYLDCRCPYGPLKLPCKAELLLRWKHYDISDSFMTFSF